MRLEKKEDDYGVNFYLNSTTMGSINAYTYQNASIMESLKILKDFSNDENNKENLLYEQIQKIKTILNFITGGSSFASLSQEESKEEVLSNVSKYLSCFALSSTYDEVGDNNKNNPELYYPVENTIRIDLDLEKIAGICGVFTVVLDFSSEVDKENALFGIGIENLKIGDNYSNIKAYVMDENNLTISDFKVNEFNDKNRFIDLRDLPTLVKMGIKTCEASEYHISGTFSLNAIPLATSITGFQDRNLNISVFIKVRDEKDENGLRLVDCIVNTQLNDFTAKWDDESSVTWHKTNSIGWGYYTYDAYRQKISNTFYIHRDEVYVKKIKYTEKESYQSVNAPKVSWKICNYSKKSGWNFDHYDIEYYKTSPTNMSNDILYVLFVDILDNIDAFNYIGKQASTSIDVKLLDSIQGLKINNKNNLNASIKMTLFKVVNVNLTVDMNFDPNYKLSNIKLSGNLKALGIEAASFSLEAINNDLLVESNGKTNVTNEINHLDGFINFFKNNEHTKNLGIRDGHNDNTNVYKVTISDGNDGIFFNGQYF